MEMRRYRLRLDSSVPFGTPPTSGSLFGMLCWAFRARHGRDALRAFLRRLPEEPFLLSDVLPADHLPRPLLPAPRGEAPEARPEIAKSLKRRRFLPLSGWRGLRAGANAAGLRKCLENSGASTIAPDPPFLVHARAPHNRIDRRSGKTPAAGGGGLWFADELWPRPGERTHARQVLADLYVRTAMPAGQVEFLLAEIGAQGFGRDATYGRGRFALEGGEAVGWLLDAPKAGSPRMLSLSQGVVTPNMEAPRWRRFVLFGKLGREMVAEGRRPWKLPLVLAESGCTFTARGAGPFGAWLTGLHQDDDPDDPVGHNGFHLAIPYREAL